MVRPGAVLPLAPSVAEGVLFTVTPPPAIWAGAPVLTSGTAITGVTVRLPLANLSSSGAGIVMLHVPSAAGVVEREPVVLLPSLADTDTPVASGCARPETGRPSPGATVLGAVVIAFRAHGAIELHPAIGPVTPLASSLGWTTVLVEVEPPPKEPV